MKAAFPFILVLCVIVILCVGVGHGVALQRAPKSPARSSTVPQLYTFANGPHWYLTKSVSDERASFIHHPDCPCNHKIEQP